MEKKENQRVALTRRLLYEALVEILKKKHINQVTVTELCAKAGINRATFYTHYSTPNDILIWMFEKHAYNMNEIQMRQRAGKSSTDQVIVECCEYLYEYREYFKILIKNGIDEALGSQVIDATLRRMTAPVLMRDEQFDDDDRQLISACIANGCYKLISKWLMDDLPKTPREVAALILRVFSQGWLEI